MRLLSVVLLFALSMPLSARELTLERLFSDPALTGPSPRSLKVSPDGARVTFLKGRTDDQNQLDLWEYHLADNRTRLLVDSKTLAPQERINDEEKARRERTRTASLRGILDYRWAPDGSRLLFPLGDALYLYTLEGATVRKLATGDLIDPQISPLGTYVSFVRDQNLHVVELTSGDERTLTQDGGGTLHNAEAEFVAQEEMDQTSGYWWAPDDSLIAFKRYDESTVPVTRRFEVYANRTDIIEQRYPATGGANVKLSLGLVTPGGGDVRWIDLGKEQDIYLPRVNWTADPGYLTFQRQSRDQRSLDLVRVDVQSLNQKRLLQEHSDTWVNLHADLRFLKSSPHFVWASERSGYKHLYLYDLDGKLLHPLTRGDWPLDQLRAIDEARGLVYFESNKDAVIDRQLYAVDLQGKQAATPRRITQRDGWHEVDFAPTGSLYVDTFSDPSTPPQVSVHAPDGQRLAWIEANTLDDRHPYASYREGHITPTFGSLKASDGQDLWYRLYKPADFDPSRRYPVMVHFYGGPTKQLVTRAWDSGFPEFMARQGYLVFTLDNRGVERRGRRFSDVVHLALGYYEVRDQLAGIQWLKQQAYVDPGRIGVFGWSYGGYLALMMLAQEAQDLAGGVAVAPVTDWALYDTHYTERYLSTPQNNPGGYAASSVFAWLDGLTAPLLLMHGMADDNVLFLNSTQLMAALQERDIPFDLMTYPGGKHRLDRTPQMRLHAYRTIYNFFETTVRNRPTIPQGS